MDASVFRQAGVECRTDLPLAPISSFRIGGNASIAVFPKDAGEVAEVIGICREAGETLRVVGSGSNILFPDEPLDGVTLFTEGLKELEVNGTRIRAGAGVSVMTMCLEAKGAGLTGLEFAYGIPGSVGGGVFMNCGAYGGEFVDVLDTIEFVDCEGNYCSLPVSDAELGHRRSIFSEGGLGEPAVITGATFSLEIGDKSAIEAKMNELMARRRERQPLDKPSAGSFFKRPEGAYASALIDKCGLKGLSVGGAAVSEKHAGFIVNLGGATSADVKELARQVKEIVFQKAGFVLEPEVRYF